MICKGYFNDRTQVWTQKCAFPINGDVRQKCRTPGWIQWTIGIWWMIHHRKDRKNPGHADHAIRDSLNRCSPKMPVSPPGMTGTSNRASDHRMHYKDTNFIAMAQWHPFPIHHRMWLTTLFRLRAGLADAPPRRWSGHRPFGPPSTKFLLKRRCDTLHLCKVCLYLPYEKEYDIGNGCAVG